MIHSLLLPLVLLAPVRPASVYFEQATITSRGGERHGEGVLSRVWYAGRKMRMEAGGASGGPAIVLRMDRGAAYRLDPAKREAVRLDIEDLRLQAQEAAGVAGQLMGADPESEVRTAELPRGKTVAGHACRGFRLRSGGTVMDVYVAPELPLTAAAFVEFLTWSGARAALPSFMDAIEKLPGFPLETRSQVTVLDELHETVATITRIKVGPLPASLFEVPAGWRVRDSAAH